MSGHTPVMPWPSVVDVLVVGAGPAGIAAALRTAGTSHLVVGVLEAGRPHRRRRCPVDAGGTCHGCSGICNVISGFGGSVHYGDAVKLSRFPAGRRLLHTLGEARGHVLAAQAEELLVGPGTAFTGLRGGTAGFEGFRVKDYPVVALAGDEVRRLVESWFAQITAHPRTHLVTGQQVLRIDGQEGDFRVHTVATGGIGPTHTIRAGHVIVAVGRRGQRWWSDELRRLGLDHTPPTPSVGVRFECPPQMLAGAGERHADFKATRVQGGVKVKTFCLCAGLGGGRIKFTDYGEHTLLDGHVVPEPGGQAANLALLAQLRDDHGRPRGRAWIESHLLAPYRQLRTDRPGKPVAQWYPDFRSRSLTCTSLDEIRDRTGVRTPVVDYQVADIAGILPRPIHAAFCSVFEDLMAGFTRPRPGRRAPSPFDPSQVAVIGLELESLWDQLHVSAGMETSLPGLFACGDCSGLAQGILQAATSGVAAAEEITARCSTGTLTTSRAGR